MQFDAIILGAGPAGLSIAHELQRAGAKVKLLESSNRVGGSIRTVHDGEWTVETGPNTLQTEGDADLEILNGYGLKNEMQFARTESAKRFILSRGKLYTLTAHPSSLLKSDLLSFTEKLRLASEIFRPRKNIPEESIQDFMTRRFGKAAADLLMDPMVSGIYAGNPSELSMASCFPAIHALEKSHRSILLGLMQRAKTERRIVGFKAGMQQLADAMAKPLVDSEALEKNIRITEIKKEGGIWTVNWVDQDNTSHNAISKRVIITLPHWHWSQLPLPSNIKQSLEPWHQAKVPSVTVVARGYNRTDIPHSLDGFGYLVPSNENREILGCLFPSSVFSGHTPKDKVLLCSFIGGVRRPDLAGQSDEQIRLSVNRELSEALGIKNSPVKEWIQRWPQAIPQYDSKQGTREKLLEQIESEHGGLHFLGAFRHGVSLMSVIRRGHTLAQWLSR
jgi:oxygen-dependent protoporphyrinogen oxidase